MKEIVVFTLFPDYFIPFKDLGVISRAFTQNYCSLRVVSLREYGRGRYKDVDDTPYGGGPGMVMRADVLFKAM